MEKELKIDLSDLQSIQNIDAMQNDNPAIKDFNNKISNSGLEKEKEEKVLTAIEKGYQLEKFEKYPRKFEFVQPEKVKLPSNGLCYQNCEDEDVRNGYIWIYPLTMKEEEILSTNKYIYDGTATIIALNNCIKSKINAMDLIVSDFYFLLLYLRKLSISNTFDFDLECKNCGHKFKYSINISDQNFDELNKDTFKEPIRIDLPRTKYTVLLCLPRIKTIRELSWFINNAKTEIGIAEFLYTRTLAIISDKGEEVDKDDWILFYNNLPHEDSETLIKFSEFDNGLQHFVKEAVCPSCGKTIEGSSVDLNTDALFLFPSEQSSGNKK